MAKESLQSAENSEAAVVLSAKKWQRSLELPITIRISSARLQRSQDFQRST